MDNKTMAIVGLILGICVPIAGIIVSAICLNKYKQTGGSEQDGYNLAKAGLIVGIVLTALSLLWIPCAVCGGALAALGA